jgi:hypothetical protein
MYNREQLIVAVKQEIENVMLQYENDNEITEVNIRLQLVDGSHYIHIDYRQYDTDHRGSWRYGTVITKNHIKIAYNVKDPLNMYGILEDATHPSTFNALAEEIVDEALDDYELNEMEVEKIMKDVDDELNWNK